MKNNRTIIGIARENIQIGQMVSIDEKSNFYLFKARSKDKLCGTSKIYFSPSKKAVLQ